MEMKKIERMERKGDEEDGKDEQGKKQREDEKEE